MAAGSRGFNDLVEFVIGYWGLEPLGYAALDGKCAGYRGDDCGDELENLDDCIPVDFLHTFVWF